MTYARRFPNAVVLPDGKVLVTGGTRVGNNGGADAVYAAEIWNPATGTWTLGASAAQIRVYHSATLMLANGTVLSTGGGAPGPVNNLNAELYYPPYLFRTRGRRGAARAAAAHQLDQLARLQPRQRRAAAHGRRRAGGAPGDAGQRLGDALVQQRPALPRDPASRRTAPSISATLPASASLAPPGYYQIVALDAAGVPSRGAIVSLGLQGELPAAQSDIARNQAVTLESTNAAGQSVTVDSDGIAGLAATPNTARAPAAAQFWVRNGLADANCLSLESVASPGQWLRRREQRATVEAADGSPAFAGDATFCPQSGLSGAGLSLRAFGPGDLFLRHHGNELWLEAAAGDAAFAADASFVPRSTLPQDAVVQLASVDVDGSAVAVDANNLGVLAALGSTPSEATLAPARYSVRAGLGDANCVSFESVAAPGRWLRHCRLPVQSSALRRHSAVPRRRHLLPRTRPGRHGRVAALEELPRHA